MSFKKFINFIGDELPILWAVLWIITITIASFGGVLWSVKWVLELLGVM